MTEGTRSAIRALRELARENGIQTSYRDAAGRIRVASVAALMGTLRALGIPLERPEDAGDALRATRLARWSRHLEPVTVAPRGRLDVTVRLPYQLADARLVWRLALENGEERVAGKPVRLDPIAKADIEGVEFVEARLTLPERFPPGFHRLSVATGSRMAESFVIATPSERLRDDGRRGWGVFIPLYALRSARNWGVGDLTDLGDLAEWAGGLGGETVATLPLLAAFLDEPFEPSPYSPASRLFWNELFIDVGRVPELADSAEARALVSSRIVSGTARRLRQLPLVDYRRAMGIKRQVLETLSRGFFSRPEGGRWEAFRTYMTSRRFVEDYARFRAACERHGKPWMDWPPREQAGRLPPGGGERDAFRYHEYVQWLAAEQMDDLAGRSRRAGTGLYFDMPLGVNPASFDVWKERAAFATESSTGAPPDPFFTGGQNWGFFPLHPERIREQGYRYPIACLRHVLRHASVVRIDHVMGLHRLYWVPAGHDATDGAYVRYRPHELYAILDVESRRAGATIVGEDLGTVQAEVRTAMARHGVHRSFVLPYELIESPRPAIRPVPRRSFAALNTHDMAPFAGYWQGKDLEIREALGWTDVDRAKADREERARQRWALVTFLRRTGRLPATGEVRQRDLMTASLEHLAGSQARMVVVNLEDLWMETQPQNVPGTVDEYPNWRRVAHYPLERIRALPQVVGTLRRIDALRRGKTLR